MSFDELADKLSDVVQQCSCANRARLGEKVATMFVHLYTFEDTDSAEKSLNIDQQRAISMHFPLPGGKLSSMILGRM